MPVSSKKVVKYTYRKSILKYTSDSALWLANFINKYIDSDVREIYKRNKTDRISDTFHYGI